MRQDKILIDVGNPFDSFTKCKELTIVLSKDHVMLVGSIPPTNIMLSYKSIVREVEDSEEIKLAYTIPLSLVLKLFRLDTKKRQNMLVIETSPESVTLIYNGVEITTPIFSPNGLTANQILAVGQGSSIQVPHFTFIEMMDIFSANKENFLNVKGNKFFISDSGKCLIRDWETDLGMDFALPISFIRTIKSFGVKSLHVGDIAIAECANGLRVLCNLSKVQDASALDDYKFAAKVKSDDIYSLTLDKYLRRVNVAVQTAEVSIEFNLTGKFFILRSETGEEVKIKLDAREVQKVGAEDDFFSMMTSDAKPLILKDPRLIKTLASFRWVKIKVCPTFLIGKLDDNYKLMFTLRSA